ncbi:hypothetical protein ACEPAG_8977 [Sanghuangporus baumii]
MLFSFVASVFAIVLTVLPFGRAEANLTEAQIAIVVQRLADVTSHSWEYGTQSQTLIELKTPSFSVLNDTKLPPPHDAPDSLKPVFEIITEIVVNRSRLLEKGDYEGPQPLFPDEGSSADPASNGVAALIADWTRQSTDKVDFGKAAQDQMDFLWSSEVPKTSDGAISHRREEVQLWNDFIYMVPPFLAYDGVLKGNQSMVEEAYNQCRLYRQYLQDWTAGGLWKHILLGSWNDQGYWSTGHGWAAAGMLRVYGTIKNSQYAHELKRELYDLKNWVSEIHDAIYPYMREDGMFHNYANNQSTFVDAASAALIASTVYRHALLTETYTHIPHAEYVRRKLWAPKSGEGTDFADPSSFKDFVHFTSDGFLTPVVNPNNFVLEGEKSPEGQAFVIQMWAAWKDWVAHGAPGVDGEQHGGYGSADQNEMREFAAHRSRMARVRRSFHD